MQRVLSFSHWGDDNKIKAHDCRVNPWKQFSLLKLLHGKFVRFCQWFPKRRTINLSFSVTMWRWFRGVHKGWILGRPLECWLWWCTQTNSINFYIEDRTITNLWCLSKTVRSGWEKGKISKIKKKEKAATYYLRV